MGVKPPHKLWRDSEHGGGVRRRQDAATAAVGVHEERHLRRAPDAWRWRWLLPRAALPIRRVLGHAAARPPPPPFGDVVRALRDSLEALLPAFYRFASALVYSPEEEEEEEGSLSIVVDAGGGVAFVEAEAFVASVVRSPRGMMVAGLGPRFAMQQQPTVFVLPPPPPPQ